MNAYEESPLERLLRKHGFTTAWFVSMAMSFGAGWQAPRIWRFVTNTPSVDAQMAQLADTLAAVEGRLERQFQSLTADVAAVNSSTSLGLLAIRRQESGTRLALDTLRTLVDGHSDRGDAALTTMATGLEELQAQVTVLLNSVHGASGTRTIGKHDINYEFSVPMNGDDPTVNIDVFPELDVEPEGGPSPLPAVPPRPIPIPIPVGIPEARPTWKNGLLGAGSGAVASMATTDAGRGRAAAVGALLGAALGLLTSMVGR